MFVLILSRTCVWSISNSKNWERYNNNCILVFMKSARYYGHILMKFEFSQQIIEKYSNI